MTGVETILVAIASDSVFALLKPILGRSDLSIRRVRSGHEALSLANGRRFDLIVCQQPMGDIEFGEFHAALRSATCSSRAASLLIMTRQNRLATLTDFATDERARLFCLEQDPRELLQLVGEIVGAAVRSHSRLMIETRVVCEGEGSNQIFQTANISESGFLLRCSKLLPLGERVRFGIALPDSDQPVHGLAEVARHTQPQESIRGMALRILELEADGGKRLGQFIRAQEGRASDRANRDRALHLVAS